MSPAKQRAMCDRCARRIGDATEEFRRRHRFEDGSGGWTSGRFAAWRAAGAGIVEAASAGVPIVYFVLAPSLGRLKIGTASLRISAREKEAWRLSGSAASPFKRFDALKTASPVGLRLVAWLPGDCVEEGELHRKFRRLRRRGEWFRYGPELRRFCEGVARMTPEERRAACSAWLAARKAAA